MLTFALAGEEFHPWLFTAGDFADLPDLYEPPEEALLGPAEFEFAAPGSTIKSSTSTCLKTSHDKSTQCIKFETKYFQQEISSQNIEKSDKKTGSLPA